MLLISYSFISYKILEMNRYNITYKHLNKNAKKICKIYL